MYTFRKLKRRLEHISPPEVLQAIQSIVDLQVTKHRGRGQKPTQMQTSGYDYIDFDEIDVDTQGEESLTVRRTPTDNTEQTRVGEVLSKDEVDSKDQKPTKTPEQTPTDNTEQTRVREVLSKDEVDSKGQKPTKTPQQTPTDNTEQTRVREVLSKDKVDSKGQKPTKTPEQTPTDNTEQTRVSEVLR